jgi:hypothetical protein
MAKGRKTGGRKKGSPNRDTTELKVFFDSVDFCIPEQIIELLPLLDDSKKVETLLRLLEFVYPKRKALEVRSEDFTKMSFVEALSVIDI